MGAYIGDWLQLWVSALGTIFTTLTRKKNQYLTMNIWDEPEGITLFLQIPP